MCKLNKQPKRARKVESRKPFDSAVQKRPRRIMNSVIPIFVDNDGGNNENIGFSRSNFAVQNRREQQVHPDAHQVEALTNLSNQFSHNPAVGFACMVSLLLVVAVDILSTSQENRRSLALEFLSGFSREANAVAAPQEPQNLLHMLPAHQYCKQAGTATEICENEKCCICLAPYVNGDRMKALPCLHAFHASCIDCWLVAKSVPVCPICKSLVQL